MSIAATIRQHAERAVPDEAPAILAEGLVAHVAFVDGDQPYVLPMSYHYDPATPDRLWLHGGPSSRLLGTLAAGAKVSLGVTLVDGLVFSRSAKYHSLNYRSAVGFGQAHAVTDRATKERVFAAMVARYFPGRTAGRDYEAPPALHTDATLVLEITLTALTAKARRGGPKGPHDADESSPGTAGVRPLPGAPA